MRIACIGNMNNNMFSLVRFLRDRSLDAELLILDNELEHFGPACDAFDDEYLAYTHRLPWGDIRHFLRTPAPVIAASVERYDVLVACGSAPGFLHKGGRTVDVFAPYGSDFMDYPFLRLVRPRWMFSDWAFRIAQRRAILRSRALMFDHGNPELDRIVERIGYQGPRIPHAIPMVYAPQYNPETVIQWRGRSTHYEAFTKIRQEHQVVVFSSNRHIWTHPTAYSWDKGTERLIRGFASFVADHPRARPALVLFSYGTDVEDSRRLVSELGIQEQVFWFPTMERRELMMGLSMADFGVGELAHSFMTCGTILEALALGKPLLGYRDDALYHGSFSSLYPMANVASAGDIARLLGDFLDRPDHYRSIGAAGRRWFDQHGVEAPLDALLDTIRHRNGVSGVGHAVHNSQSPTRGAYE